MEPVAALERIAYLLERAGEPTYRVRAFRGAADIIRSFNHEELATRIEQNRLRELPGIGKTTEEVIREAARGATPGYLMHLEAKPLAPLELKAEEILSALKGDCHTHSDWSDGGSPIQVMARSAQELGHEYIVLTDHSPRLTIANGLSPDRLREQLVVVAKLNEQLSPFRILTGIEVDILEDGGIDQEDELLSALDVVVASVHSKLRMDAAPMTRRMVAAIANPHVDILGHCTGRLVTGRGRPESSFDPEMVFAACKHFDKAVEINSRPERLDPPIRLLEMAMEYECKVSIDTDAHAPGQLAWLANGCRRAAQCDVPLESIVNTNAADDLLLWAKGHEN